MKHILYLFLFVLCCLTTANASQLGFQVLSPNGFEDTALMNVQVHCVQQNSQKTYHFQPTNVFGVTTRIVPEGPYRCYFTYISEHHGKIEEHVSKRSYYVAKNTHHKHHVIPYLSNTLYTQSPRYTDAAYHELVPTNTSFSTREPVTATLAIAFAVTSVGLTLWDAYDTYQCVNDPYLTTYDCVDEVAFLALNFVPAVAAVKVGKFFIKGTGTVIKSLPYGSKVINAFGDGSGYVLTLVRDKTGKLLLYETVQQGSKHVDNVITSSGKILTKFGESIRGNLMPQLSPNSVRIGSHTVLKKGCGEASQCQGLLGEISLVEYVKGIDEVTKKALNIKIFKGRKGKVLAETDEVVFRYGEKPYSVEIINKKSSGEFHTEFDGVFEINGKLVVGEVKTTDYKKAKGPLMSKGQIDKQKRYADVLAKELNLDKQPAEVLILLPKDAYNEGMRRSLGHKVTSSEWLHADYLPAKHSEYKELGEKLK